MVRAVLVQAATRRRRKNAGARRFVTRGEALVGGGAPPGGRSRRRFASYADARRLSRGGLTRTAMDLFGHLNSYDYGEVHFARQGHGPPPIVAIHDTRLGPALGGCWFR